ncbi:hypothetical protein D6779_04700 [Candidatus Parcubacteria bacterium]|nr:MAG: hypothetical protein D6779_04700 [Candidatus Parcubacteria bacterium]
MMDNPLCQHQCNKEHYTADACVVWCFDDRFRPAREALAQSLGLRHYDLVSVAGGAKALVKADNDADREALVKQIKTSIRLHHPAKVILMLHTDCGAYGGRKAFNDNEEAERITLTRDLQQAKQLLTARLQNGVEIIPVFVTFRDTRIIS